jgi:N-acyl-D-amino-acid deacylase
MTHLTAPYDLKLSHGVIIDGSGDARFNADVAIAGERIAAVGDLREIPAKVEIDVSGLVVTPGFIDVHTHDDAAVILRPAMLAKLSQGVTTVIGGNCGLSGAPYDRPGNPENLLRLLFKSDRCMAPTMADFLARVASAAPAINAAFLTGHTTLRMQVMGSDLARGASSEEIARMRDLLAQSLEDGSLGLSTGLFYPPARAATMREVIEVAQPLRNCQGLYATHMRDEADGVMDSLRETLEIGRAVAVPVIISHHKCMGTRNFGRSAETLALIGAATRHQSVSLDVYPYTACSTVLNEEMIAQARRTLITWSDRYPELSAHDFDDIVAAWGCSRAEAVERLQPAGAIYFAMDEQDVTRIMRFGATMIGSDGLPEDEHPHPRLWGTFPRVLGHYVREAGLFTLEEAVHRMTGLPAQRFGFATRGRVEVGCHADLTVFDAHTIRDTATFERPVSPAIGIRYVFVNGAMAWKEGAPIAHRAGRVLRRGCS